ncbi:MAG: [FeFe] hydrogenase H-cluster radical SAM maturase HydE, partial [Kiritimatiellae bacterium]|nr:[FeFe] hydrogenase H-cluster radical SAM maturase HydE [Kiritimatiellia bacterium]
PSCDWQRRAECLKYLNECGYQTGTGTMSSLPGQTINDLAHDIVFFNESKAVMIGMGPYLSHPDTPLAKCDLIFNQDKLERALDMIAVTRLYLHDVNIASTTALEALADDGREQGILAGANVVMPNVTDVTRRKSYQLYSGKPGLDETSLAAKERLDCALAAIGEEIDYATRGDSPRAQGE